MDDYLAGLSTEGINEDTRNIDLCSTEEMVAMINRQDALVAGAVAAEQQHIARAVDLIYQCFKKGGVSSIWGPGPLGGWACWTPRNVSPPSASLRKWCRAISPAGIPLCVAR